MKKENSNKLWRCPRCETMNTGKECVVCGHQSPSPIPDPPKYGKIAAACILGIGLFVGAFLLGRNSADNEIETEFVDNTFSETSISVSKYESEAALETSEMMSTVTESETMVTTTVPTEHTTAESSSKKVTTAATSAEVSDTVTAVTLAMDLVTVPRVIELSYVDAQNSLKKAGLKYEIVYEDKGSVRKGYVFKQSIASGNQVEKDTVITLYVDTHEETRTTTNNRAFTTANYTYNTSAISTQTTTVINKEIEYYDVQGNHIPNNVTYLLIQGKEEWNEFEYHGDYENSWATTPAPPPNGFYRADIYEPLKDVDFLKKFESVYLLDLCNNKIEDISPISNLSEIRWLYLDNNNIIDIDCLKNLNGLEYLSLKYNMITDISVLKELKNLDEIHLECTLVNKNDVAILQKFLPDCTIYYESTVCMNNDQKKIYISNEMKELNLSYKSLNSISQLSKMNELSMVDLSYNNISDLKPLYGLKKLKELHLTGNPLKTSDLEKLSQALPDCKIYFNGLFVADTSKNAANDTVKDNNSGNSFSLSDK